MKKNKLFSGAQKEKASIIAASVFVLSALTLTGVYFSTKEEPQQQNMIDFAKDTTVEDKVKESQTVKKEVAHSKKQFENRYIDTTQNSDMDRELSYTEVVSNEVKNDESEIVTQQEEIKEKRIFSFGPDEKLEWPIVGKVILGYSMDKAVYFKTMQQYKYNPSVVIEAKVGDTITAAADGVVKEISTKATTGNTLVCDLGDGYELTYGQITDVTLQVGDEINAGDYIGKVATPTIYFTEEGSNVYFALAKDGEPIDPFNYFEE